MTVNVDKAAEKFEQWQPKANQESYLTINTLECHTGGEPLRIITSGFPALKGEGILAKVEECKDDKGNTKHLDLYA